MFRRAVGVSMSLDKKYLAFWIQNFLRIIFVTFCLEKFDLDLEHHISTLKELSHQMDWDIVDMY